MIYHAITTRGESYFHSWKNGTGVLMNPLPPMRFGLTGLGGYAGYLCERLLEEAASPAPAAQLVAVSDPDVARYPLMAEQLRKHGVRVLDSYQQLLSMPIDAVWLPLPI